MSAPKDPPSEIEDKLTKTIIDWAMDKLAGGEFSGTRTAYLGNMTLGHARDLAERIQPYVKEQQG